MTWSVVHLDGDYSPAVQTKGHGHCGMQDLADLDITESEEAAVEGSLFILISGLSIVLIAQAIYLQD